MVSFIDELLSQVSIERDQTDLSMDRVRADQMLMALEKLDSQTEEIERTACQETELIEMWRESELERLEKKRTWICWNLEQFLRSMEEKSLRLPHGVIKSRMGRDRVEIVDEDLFLSVAKERQLLRTYPERSEPDLNLIQVYIRRTGEIPPGIELIPGEARFSYALVRKGEEPNGDEQAET